MWECVFVQFSRVQLHAKGCSYTIEDKGDNRRSYAFQSNRPFSSHEMTPKSSPSSCTHPKPAANLIAFLETSQTASKYREPLDSLDLIEATPFQTQRANLNCVNFWNHKVYFSFTKRVISMKKKIDIFQDKFWLL